MSILTVYIGEPSARYLAGALRAKGFAVTPGDCQGYVANVVQHVAGADPDDRRTVLNTIEQVLPSREDRHE